MICHIVNQFLFSFSDYQTVLFGEFERNLMKRAKLGTISDVQCNDNNLLQLQFKTEKEKCENNFNSELEENILKGDLFN